MKQRMSNKKTIALFAPFMGLIAVVMAALIVLSVMFAPTISRFLGGIGGDDLSEETLSEGTELVEDIVEEGTVLLKNEDDALPLSADEMTKVNVFGWAAYDWMTSTYGSGYSNTTLTKVKFFDALQAANIQYNTTLYDMYKNFYSATTSKWGMSDLREYRGDVEVGGTRKFVLHEPGADYYTDEIIAEAREFSSVALVVIGRTGGEAADLRFHQEKQVQSDGSSATVTDNTRTYLQLSTEEEEMIAAAAREEYGLDGVELFYNDYKLNDPAKREACVQVVEMLREEGLPVDGIGMQGHYRLSDYLADPEGFLDEFEASVKTFTGLGLDVHITELDIRVYASDDEPQEFDSLPYAVEEQQAEMYAGIFEVLRKYAVPWKAGAGCVTNVTVWGLADDSRAWDTAAHKEYPLLFNEALEPKQAYYAIISF